MTALLKRYGLNTKGRDYVVRDIHGQFWLLETLLAHMGFDQKQDRLFSVGDMIDRGPESHRMTEFLAAQWFHAILGNHEVMLMNSAAAIARGRRDDGNIDLWRANGGAWFFGLASSEQQTVLAAIKRLPVTAEISLPGGVRAGLVHASVGSQWSELGDRSQETFECGHLDYFEDLIWNRELAHAALGRVSGRTNVDVGIQGIDVVFFGHTPMQVPIRVDNTRWLDTGGGTRHDAVGCRTRHRRPRLVDGTGGSISCRRLDTCSQKMSTEPIGCSQVSNLCALLSQRLVPVLLALY